MKISKLFHWLYAILMLLPFAFFVPSVLYYAFNDNATMQSVEVPKTETIAVDFNQLMPTEYTFDVPTEVTENGNGFTAYAVPNSTNTKVIFYFDWLESHQYLLRFNASVNQNNVVNYTFLYNPSYSEYFTEEINSGVSLLTYIYVPTSDNVGQIQFYRDMHSVAVTYTNINLFDLTQMFGVGNEPTVSEFNLMFPRSYYSYIESQPMQITYDTGETEQLIENTSIINYAWESIWDLPLFSWTKVTFVSVPFAFLTGLFGIGANSSLNYVFGYFATISICWLVFDVIMYVPMLVHRWIDKARIE